MLGKKHAWIRIVEAAVAILLIAGVVLIVLGQGNLKKQDPSEEIYKAETAILRDIQKNDRPASIAEKRLLEVGKACCGLL